MSTTRFDLSVEVDMEPLLAAMGILMPTGPLTKGEIEKRIRDALKTTLKSSMPYVTTVKDFDYADC